MDYERLRNLTARELAAALARDGFVLSRQNGSHRLYKNADGRRVTLSFHKSSATFPLGTLRKMIKAEANWGEDDLVRLGLL